MGCNQFVGTWKLISCEAERDDGQVVYPFGANPIGMLMYDATGHMAAQLMRTDRPKFASDDRLRATLEEKRAAFDGFVAYYGTYEVTEEDAIVTHHVEGSIFPNNIGSDQRRGYKFLDGKLLLLPPPREVEGQQQIASLTWERIS